MKEIIKKEDLIIKLGLLFYFCSILGYIYELILCYFYSGKIFSHGILSGPWLPIYGTGSVLIMLFYKYRKNPFLIFVLSFFVTGTLEYICGVVLLKFFKMRLWDYTGHFLNIGGRVCLLSAFCFGIGGLLITYLIYPFIKKMYNKVNKKVLKAVIGIISGLFLTDIIASILK
ncbi:MAG: hypothetical protein E7161_00395 [Firmicutes bacterium]|nr:hypothetical protein [Bacillota bacterium]